MRIFVAGASGVVGRSLLPVLIKAGHQVIGMTHSPEKRELVQSLGAEHVAADVLDQQAVLHLVQSTRPGKRRFPIVGNGGAVWSFIHLDDDVAATLAAVTGGEPGIYNAVDDEPAEVSVWLPELARIVGAPPPKRVPAWLARFAIGEAGVIIMTQARGASNRKAKSRLGWSPSWKPWRDGFRHEAESERQTLAA